MTTAPHAALSRPALVIGQVIHHRLHPVEHRMTYPALCLRLPLSRLRDLPRLGLPVNRFGWLTFDSRDHGARDGSSLTHWIQGVLRDHRIEADGEVELVCFPRMLGYAFKPVSFWLCRDKSGGVRAVVAEVHNTFGEAHNYLLANDDGSRVRNGQALTAENRFHVSPFLAIEGRYSFRFQFDGDRWLARIDYADVTGRLVLTTSVAGECVALDRAALRRARYQFPLQAFAVVARIHWNALLLWCKRLAFHTKPEPIPEKTTR